MKITDKKITLTLKEIDDYLVGTDSWDDPTIIINSGIELIKFDLIDTIEHSMNLGHIYKIVFKYKGELFISEHEFDYGYDSEMWCDYIANDGDENDYDFFPAEEIAVIDYRIVK